MTTQVARRSRHDGTYSEVLAWLLRDAGYDVDVRNAGRWFEEIDDGFRRFLAEELTEFPDVLVVHYGFNESRALVLPRALLQHFTRMRLHTWDEGMRWAGRAYRRVFVPRLWPVVRRYQQLASATAGVRLWRMTPARFARELRRLVTFARGDRMLVLVADLIPPPPRILHFIPGMDERRAIYQRTLSQIISGFDDDEVRLVAVSRVIDELGFDKALTDGLHFSPLGHRRVAELIAAEVAPWLDAHGAADPRPSAPPRGGHTRGG